jgi:hypothetical protein
MKSQGGQPKQGRTKRRGPIFIGGTGRSGTTVLVWLLGRHSQLFNLRWESQFLVAPNGLINLAERGWRPNEVKLFLQRLRGRWFYRIHNPGKDNEYVGGLCHDITMAELRRASQRLEKGIAALEGKGREESDALIANFVEGLFRPASERVSAARWCEKTPRNVLFMERLYQLFPDMRFIHIVRDGRDVVASMMRRGFWPVAAGHEFPTLAAYQGDITPRLAAGYWAEVLALAETFTTRIPPSSYFELRLEDLVSRPDSLLQELCEFLGEDFDPKMLEHDLSRHHSGHWKQALSARDVAVIQEVAGEMLARKGYEA